MNKYLLSLVCAVALSGCASIQPTSNAKQCSDLMSNAWPSSPITDKVSDSQNNGQLVTVTGIMRDAGMWKENLGAKIECRFNGNTLASFKWILPERLAARGDAK